MKERGRVAPVGYTFEEEACDLVAGFLGFLENEKGTKKREWREMGWASWSWE